MEQSQWDNEGTERDLGLLVGRQGALEEDGLG